MSTLSPLNVIKLRAMSENVAASLNRVTGAIRGLKIGFGFIAGDDGHDYFFHWSAMDKSSKNFRELVMQERVEFDVAQSERGLRAINIRVIGD